jgi:septal ring factor EnvC (AmiA/AmiB activator)
MVGAVLVTSALLVGALLVASNAHGALDHTDASLAATRTQLHRTLGRLARARATLASVAGASHSAATVLGSDESQLAAVQGQLTAAQDDQRSQGVNIADLDQCLSGVEVALNQVSLGASGAAGLTLGSVASVCRAAEPTG